MFVAFDDTDSREGMCTTFLATEVAYAMRQYDLIGLPRLVRLNPAIPWKTRGNAAICMRFGRGKGPATLAAVVRDTPLFAYPRSAGEPDAENVRSVCLPVMKRWSRLDEGASPGMVISARAPAPSLYWKAVRGEVPRKEADDALMKVGALRSELAGGRGIIGASAAMSWRPADRTFELITYREEGRWGTDRSVSAASVVDFNDRVGTTFNTWDDTIGQMAIAPHTPCPVLFGVRGDTPADLVRALDIIRSEPVDRWMLFLSNQGTDDHVIRNARSLSAGGTYMVEGTVEASGHVVKGGHVIVPISTRWGTLECAFYEPSRSFRGVGKALIAGDKVQIIGEMRERPRAINVEKVRVVELARCSVKSANPFCRACRKSMQSMGSGAGYRCRRCGAKEPTTAAEYIDVPRALAVGWYEPPVCSRRHLAKPLKRQLASSKDDG
jgi:tRNA(Ile2)-agmatinylcytidine synthase